MRKKNRIKMITALMNLALFMSVLGLGVMAFGGARASLMWSVGGAALFQIGLGFILLFLNLRALIQKYMDVYDENDRGIYQVFQNLSPRPFWTLIAIIFLAALALLVTGVMLLLADPSSLNPTNVFLQLQGV